MAKWLNVPVFEIRSAINAGCDTSDKLKEYIGTRDQRIYHGPFSADSDNTLIHFALLNHENS